MLIRNWRWRIPVTRLAVGLVLACGVAVSARAAGSSASVAANGIQQAWWRNPALKCKVDTGAKAPMAGPYYMNKDESERYLFVSCGWCPTDAGVLYSVRDLLNASPSNAVSPIASAIPETFYGAGCWRDSWRGGGLSDELGLVVTGNYRTNRNTSLLFTNSWIRNVNVFTIANDTPPVAISALGFSHDSSRLYSSVFRDEPDSDTRKLYEWKVGNLATNGIGLTFNAAFATSVSCIQNPGVYYIGGKDLVYYGEGCGSLKRRQGSGGGKVCVYDPAAGKETILISDVPPAYDIISVKVAGVRARRMHLYVQCDGGSLYIYDLASDGKSVGSLVQAFAAPEMHMLLGSAWAHMGAFEVTDDETHAFFSHHPAQSRDTIQLYIVSASKGARN